MVRSHREAPYLPVRNTLDLCKLTLYWKARARMDEVELLQQMLRRAINRRSARAWEAAGVNPRDFGLAPSGSNPMLDDTAEFLSEMIEEAGL